MLIREFLNAQWLGIMQPVGDLKSIVGLDQNEFGCRVNLTYVITAVHNEFVQFALLLDNATLFDEMTEGGG